MKTYAIGVDIGGTTVKTGIFEKNGKVIDHWEIPTRTENNGVNILPDISDAMMKRLTLFHINRNDIEGLGIGVPGPVDSEGTVLGCVNLGWDRFNIEKAMSSLTGFRVKAGNDANIAALGEYWKGGGNGFSDMIMVTLGTGIGGGVIINGHIINGFHGAAGEIGHVHVNDNETEPCGCGNKGCIEQYASATGVVRVAKRWLEAHGYEETELTRISNLSSKDIFDQAKAGDEAALSIVNEMGRLLGKTLAGIACVVAPQAFVIGGGMSKAGDILIEVIEKHFREYAFHSHKDIQFRLAELGNLAGIYGAAKIILE